MAPKYPRPQDQVLYKEDWPKAIDKEFIKQLAKFADGRVEPIKPHETNIIGASIEVVNRKFKTTYTLQTGQFWFTRLQKRHRAFSFATTVGGAKYDPLTNTITASGWLWDYIYVLHNIAEAYMVVGEPEWEKLQVIFGPPTPVDVNNLPDVIQISDDSVEQIPVARHNPVVPSSSRRRTMSNSRTNGTLGSSFWDSLSPIQQLSGVDVPPSFDTDINYGQPDVVNGDRRRFKQNENVNVTNAIALDSFERDEEGNEDALGSQASSSYVPFNGNH